MKIVDPLHDRWQHAEGEDGPRPHPAQVNYALLTLEQWHAVRAHWPTSCIVGVEVANDVDVNLLNGDVARLALIVLDFPKWTDGRAYSQARTLRTRFGYQGELRASGEVVVDMLPLLHRTGFDSAILRDHPSTATIERVTQAFSAHYQGDVHEPCSHDARSGNGQAQRSEVLHVGD